MLKLTTILNCKCFLFNTHIRKRIKLWFGHNYSFKPVCMHVHCNLDHTLNQTLGSDIGSDMLALTFHELCSKRVWCSVSSHVYCQSGEVYEHTKAIPELISHNKFLLQYHLSVGLNGIIVLQACELGWDLIPSDRNTQQSIGIIPCKSTHVFRWKCDSEICNFSKNSYSIYIYIYIYIYMLGQHTANNLDNNQPWIKN